MKKEKWAKDEKYKENKGERNQGKVIKKKNKRPMRKRKNK